MKTPFLDPVKFRNNVLAGVIVAVIYAIIEYFMKLGSDDAQAFVPLVIRAGSAGFCVMATVNVFETVAKKLFGQKTFLYVVLFRTAAYTVFIFYWLVVMNLTWFIIKGGPVRIWDELLGYFQNEMFLINMVSIFSLVLVALGLNQINSLHRKGELMQFILGKYHHPKEVELIFCFVDLKGSTTIAEKLGHKQYAYFLKDYYSDITEALRKTKAQVNEYVGDEIVLSWTFKEGLENNNCMNCFFEMRKEIENRKDRYIEKYGIYPEFKAGVHGGEVIVTWVGELKKEIVFIGDVMNTTARIQEDCKRLGKDFLISGELLEQVGQLDDLKATFLEETVLRGKKKGLKLYHLEKSV